MTFREEYKNELENEEEEIGTIERPDVSFETKEDLDMVDSMINSKMDAHDNLSKVLKDEVFAHNWRVMDVINEEKTLENKPLKDEHDYSAYGNANFRSQIFGAFSKKRFLKREGGYTLDRKKMNENINLSSINVGDNEKEDLARSEGISPEEAEQMNYTKKYSKIDGAIMKTITRDASEREKLKTSRELFNETLKLWQEGQGASLIERKEKLERHDQDSKRYDELLDDDNISEDTKKELRANKELEEGFLRNGVKFSEENLSSEINDFKHPIEIQKEESSEIISEFSATLSIVSEKETELEKKISSLGKSVKVAKKLEMAGGAELNLIRELEERIEQVRVDKEAIGERKKAISDRLKITTAYNNELKGVLDEMNSIGKTKKELLEEKELAKTKTKENKEEVGSEQIVEDKVRTDLFKGATDEEAEAGEENRRRNKEKMEEAAEYMGQEDSTLENDAEELKEEIIRTEKEYGRKIDDKERKQIREKLERLRQDQEQKKKSNLNTQGDAMSSYLGISEDDINDGNSKETKEVEWRGPLLKGSTVEKKEDLEKKISVIDIINSLNIGNKEDRGAVMAHFKNGEAFDKNSLLSIKEAKRSYANFLLNYKFKKDKSKKDEIISQTVEKINEIFKVENGDVESDKEDGSGSSEKVSGGTKGPKIDRVINQDPGKLDSKGGESAVELDKEIKPVGRDSAQEEDQEKIKNEIKRGEIISILGIGSIPEEEKFVKKFFLKGKKIDRNSKISVKEAEGAYTRFLGATKYANESGGDFNAKKEAKELFEGDNFQDKIKNLLV